MYIMAHGTISGGRGWEGGGEGGRLSVPVEVYIVAGVSFKSACCMLGVSVVRY